MAQMYMMLKYEDWKKLEKQCLDFSKIETAHSSTDGFYHKAFRLELGDLLIEFQGPLVKAPVVEDIIPTMAIPQPKEGFDDA